MGADLYIDGIFKENQAKYQPLFDKAVEKRNSTTNKRTKAKYQKEVFKYYDLINSKGYFRDSYNATALLGMIGLSWWKDVIPMLTKNGNLTPVKASGFIKMIKKAKVPTVKDMVKSLGEYATIDYKENSPEAWHKYFVNKKRRLIKFLELAIKENRNITCSI